MGRSQYVSIDTLLALALFAFVLIVALWIWHYALEKVSSDASVQDLAIVGSHAATVLFETSGSPSHWHNQTITQQSTSFIGLRHGAYISQSKLDKLNNLTSNETATIHTLLGIRGPGYNYTIFYYRYNETSEAFNNDANMTIGFTASSTTAQVQHEYIGYTDQGEYTKLQLKVWQ